MTSLSMLKIRTAVVALAVASGAAALQAQAPTHASKVTVPFAFSYGNEHFAAGQYTISIAGDNLLVVNGNGHARFVMFQSRTDSDSPTTLGYLSFRRYGNSYFLAEYQANDGVTFAIPSSSAERNLARELAMNPADPGTTRLALNVAVSSR